MYDYLEGKTPISVMGSHSLLRASHHYEQLVRLSRKLAQNGFLVGMLKLKFFRFGSDLL